MKLLLVEDSRRLRSALENGLRRAGYARHAGERAVFAGSGAGGVPFALRGEEDSRANRFHVEEWEAAEELRNRSLTVAARIGAATVRERLCSEEKS